MYWTSQLPPTEVPAAPWQLGRLAAASASIEKPYDPFDIDLRDLGNVVGLSLGVIRLGDRQGLGHVCLIGGAVCMSNLHKTCRHRSGLARGESKR